MSDDLTDTQYGRRLDESLKPPPARRSSSGKSWRLPKSVVAGALGVGLILLILITAPSFPPPSPAQSIQSAWNGRLADVTGEDELYKLKVTQVAIKREMALLREWLTGGTGGLPEEADLARTLAMLHVRQDELDGLVGRLEAGQARLEVMAMACRLELSEQSQRLSDLSRAFEAHQKEEEN